LLARPLVLLGHPGSGVSAVARVLCGRTGFPFNDVARLVEARSARSRAQIAVEDGLEALRLLERAALRDALRRTPAGVVAADTACLGEAADRDWIRGCARLVYVRRPLRTLLARIRAEVERDPGSQPEFVYAVPADERELAEHLEPRESLLGLAHVILDAADRHPVALAADLLAELEPILRAGDDA